MKSLVKGYYAKNNVELGRAVCVSEGENNQVEQGSNSPLGIYDAGYSASTAIEKGQIVPVTLSGLAEAEVANDVKTGDLLEANEQGQLVPNVEGDVIGRALCGGVAGDFIEVLVIQDVFSSADADEGTVIPPSA